MAQRAHQCPRGWTAPKAISLRISELRSAYTLQKWNPAPLLPLGTKEATMNSNWMPGVAALMGLALAGPATAAPRVIYETGDRYANTQYSAYSGQVGYENGYGDGLKR